MPKAIKLIPMISQLNQSYCNIIVLMNFKNVFLINVFFLIFRITYVLFYPISLDPEEAQYWDWARHIDFSYYSKPPLVAYLNFVSMHLFGINNLAVRIWPILFAFIMLNFSYFFVKKIYGTSAAFWSSVIPNTVIGFNINAILMTTDAPFLFFWGLSVIAMYEALHKNKLKDYIYLGIFAGLAFLAKYTAVFLVLGFIYAFIYKKDVLKSFKPYLSMLIATVLGIQVIIWNAFHHFDGFKHVGALAGIEDDASVKALRVLNFLGGQIGVLSIVWFFVFLYASFKSLKQKDHNDMYFIILSWPILLFFAILSINTNVQANWPDFAYFSAFILISKYFEAFRKKILYIGFSMLITILVMFTPILDLIGLGNILKPIHDPTKFLVGWDKLGAFVSRFYKPGDLVFSDYYQIAGELAFYMKDHPEVFCINLGTRMNEFYLWQNLMKNYIGHDGIFVSVHPIDNRVLSGFKKIIYQTTYTVYWRSKPVETYYIYVLKDYDGHIKQVKTRSY
jgi:4-amino-4-deoxy-L-arabinose transferase and related glycosyltransferases of PMT family